MTETQIRQKILLFFRYHTNHRKVLRIDEEPPPIPPDNKNRPIWYKIKVETQQGEKINNLWIQINDGFLFYGIQKGDKIHIVQEKQLKFIF